MAKQRTKVRNTIPNDQPKKSIESTDTVDRNSPEKSNELQNLKESSATKRKAKIFKIIGGIIVFLSFITQNYLYDKWNSESQNLHSATVEQAIIDKGILLNEVLYYTAGLDKSALPDNEVKNVKEQYAKQAAVKQVISHSMAVMSTDLDKQDQVDRMKKLFRQAVGVKDLLGLSELRKSINEQNDEVIQKRREARFQSIESKRNTARQIYLALYIIGTTLLIIGIRHE